ncbi:hypothetical protein KIW84_054512 [Lathyrus oleraceus]|uniref:Uncharacterized protein n=1 Tax=Pisum sativum TaxID=3888 RepID=A0A9D4WVI6_PEA|nr:hypothetical protein KIW84_054512 [Pisum sativum]
MDEGLIQICQSREIDDMNVMILVFKTPKWVVIQFDGSSNNNVNRLVSLLVIRLVGPIPYTSDKAIPYQYNATMLENGQEVSLLVTNSVAVVSKKVDVPVENPNNALACHSGESSKLKPNDDDEVLRLIKRSEFNVVEQLLQTPSKIPVLSLLINSEAHREALQRLLEQAYVEHDVTVDQFDHIVANITSYNNMSFCDEELPEEGRIHNLALHNSMNCKEDALSNVLFDTGSSLNVLPKSTMSRHSYHGAPMRYSGVIVKAFDGSRKTVIGEVNLPIKIGPSDFQITFQVMDIHPTYSCLLGRPWIHEAGAVAFTMHQKLKFVKNGKLVVVGGEKALLVSHL